MFYSKIKLCALQVLFFGKFNFAPRVFFSAQAAGSFQWPPPKDTSEVDQGATATPMYINPGTQNLQNQGQQQQEEYQQQSSQAQTHQVNVKGFLQYLCHYQLRRLNTSKRKREQRFFARISRWKHQFLSDHRRQASLALTVPRWIKPSGEWLVLL